MVPAPSTFRFESDGETPNNATLPLLLYREVVPANGGFDQRRPGEVDIDTACRAVAAVPLPEMDPVAGARGPLTTLWRRITSPRRS